LGSVIAARAAMIRLSPQQHMMRIFHALRRAGSGEGIEPSPPPRAKDCTSIEIRNVCFYEKI
jgi:hypothetical protein